MRDMASQRLTSLRLATSASRLKRISFCEYLRERTRRGHQLLAQALAN